MNLTQCTTYTHNSTYPSPLSKVGLAVGDIESIRESAKHNVMKQQARYIKDLRDKLPKFVITWTYKRLHTDRPNDVHWLRR